MVDIDAANFEETSRAMRVADYREHRIRSLAGARFFPNDDIA